jgi:predicted GNAT family acetyltransferase
MIEIFNDKISLKKDNDELGYILFNLANNQITILHTIVYEKFEGFGYASELTLKLFQYAKENNYKIKPVCSYTIGWIKRHQEWSDIINE